ncbi:MAG: hypothetical protein ACRYGL_08060 [Janthinobacterium lividum]
MRAVLTTPIMPIMPALTAPIMPALPWRSCGLSSVCPRRAFRATALCDTEACCSHCPNAVSMVFPDPNRRNDMMKKIAVLGFVSGVALFLYGRKLLAQTQTQADGATGGDVTGS